jgi:hypothetical protein
MAVSCVLTALLDAAEGTQGNACGHALHGHLGGSTVTTLLLLLCLAWGVDIHQAVTRFKSKRNIGVIMSCPAGATTSRW